MTVHVLLLCLFCFYVLLKAQTQKAFHSLLPLITNLTSFNITSSILNGKTSSLIIIQLLLKIVFIDHYHEMKGIIIFLSIPNFILNTCAYAYRYDYEKLDKYGRRWNEHTTAWIGYVVDVKVSEIESSRSPSKKDSVVPDETISWISVELWKKNCCFWTEHDGECACLRKDWAILPNV